MAIPVFARRLGVVASTTVLAVGALGGIAAACPTAGNSSSNGHSTTAPGQSKDQHGQHNGNGNGNGNNGNGSGGASAAAGSHGSAGTAGTSGNVSTPQPISTADANTGGANGQCPGGPYCSTRDGSPSGNGNGNGKATGKPCAGCVGKADNKNPKGQMPGGSDHNAGYECDRNHGIGRTNPAHTGCASTTPPVTPPGSGGSSGGTSSGGGSSGGTCTAGTVMLNGACTTPSTTTCPAGQHMVDLACVLGDGFTKHPPAGVPTSVLGERVVRTPHVGAVAGSLPFTGAPTGELALLAAAALAVGGALAVAGRRTGA